MAISKIILDMGAIFSYMIEMWETSPRIDNVRTNWIKHGIIGLSGIIGLVFMFSSLSTANLASISTIGLFIVGIGTFLSVPRIILLLLFWTHRISNYRNIEQPITYIKKAANLMMGLGLLLQLF